MYQLIPDDLISESEAASLLDCTPQAMGYRRRVSGDCPPFYDVGGLVRYSRREVLAWRRLRCAESDPVTIDAEPRTAANESTANESTPHQSS